MNKTTAKKKIARKPALPPIRLDVHPNVIIATSTEHGRDLFRYPTYSGILSPEEETFFLKAGLEAAGRKVIVSRFDSAGNPRS